MVLEVYRYGMKCLASDQGGDPWVSKTVKKLAVFDFSINEHNVESEKSLFQVTKNQFVVCAIRLNQGMTIKRQFIIRSSPNCVNVVESVVSDHGRFCNLRSNILYIRILQEVITAYTSIPNLGNFTS